jgi:putative ABC transport system substrate-binding protein
MQRREFIALLGGAAAWPVTARAQQRATPVVGFLHTLSPENVPNYVAAFHQGLKEAGFVEGQNVAIEYRWAEGQYARLSGLAADLVRRQVAVIAATGGDPSPQIAEAATKTIPIVFAANGDPVRQGLVASLNQPGGNATGVTIFGPAAVAKRLQLLHELVPQAATVAFLMNPDNPNGAIEAGVAQAAAGALGLQMLVLRANDETELDAAFAAMVQQRAGGVLVASDVFFFWRREQIFSLAARSKIPAIYYLREFAEAGGLMSYGNRVTDVYRQVGIYVGRVLKGEKPADLPVVQATEFEFVINLKTARTLGLAIPAGLISFADEVLE